MTYLRAARTKWHLMSGAIFFLIHYKLQIQWGHLGSIYLTDFLKTAIYISKPKLSVQKGRAQLKRKIKLCYQGERFNNER